MFAARRLRGTTCLASITKSTFSNIAVNGFRGGLLTISSRLLATSSGTTSAGADIWEWVPPVNSKDPEVSGSNYVIPVIKGIMLTTEEVKMYVESQGAENVEEIVLAEPLDNITGFIFATGRSSRHLRKMADSLLIAMKRRRIKKKLLSGALEGTRDDDWQVVDCGSFVVHFMLEDTRRALDLESHWRMKVRPSVKFAQKENVYEDNFEKLLEQYPCPEDYVVPKDVYGNQLSNGKIEEF